MDYSLYSNFYLTHSLQKFHKTIYPLYGASLVAQTVKNLPAMQETQVRSLSWDDPLEKGMATHSSILAWKIPWTEKPGQATAHGVAKNQTQLKRLTTFLTFRFL